MLYSAYIHNHLVQIIHNLCAHVNSMYSNTGASLSWLYCDKSYIAFAYDKSQQCL